MASLRTQWQYVEESNDTRSEAHYPVNEDANAWLGHLNGSKGKLTWFYKRCDDLQNEAMNAIEEETWFDDSCEREIEGAMQGLALAPNSSSSSRMSTKTCVIAVVGVTGSGKSSFIKRLTGKSVIGIGTGLASKTDEVKAYNFRHENVNYTLIDTPGFDDTDREDYDIFQAIVEWMENSYREGTRINGILYLHRITDRRMQGTALRNLAMFRKICGEDCFKNVLLGTTCWDLVEPVIGAAREEELSNTPEFWGDMLKRGSQILRVYPNRTSNLKILRRMMGKEGVTMKIQDELVNQGLSIQETQAVRTNSDFARLEAMRREHEAAEKAKKELIARQLKEAEIAAENVRQAREQAMREGQAAQERQRQKAIRQMQEMQRAAEKRRKRELERERQRQANVRAAQLRQEQEQKRLRREQSSISGTSYVGGCPCSYCRPRLAPSRYTTPAPKVEWGSSDSEEDDEEEDEEDDDDEEEDDEEDDEDEDEEYSEEPSDEDGGWSDDED